MALGRAKNGAKTKRKGVRKAAARASGTKAKPKAKAKTEAAAKKKTVVRTKPKAKAKAKTKAAAKKKTVTRVVAKAKTKARAKAKPKARVVPVARPSERVIAAASLVPRAERALDDTERSAMAKVAAKARLLVEGGYGKPSDVVARIAAYVEDVRRGKARPPRDRDELFGLGVLWGEQLRAQVGWLWVHLTYEEGLSSFALVPDDRAFAVFPINRLLDLLGSSAPKITPSSTLAERFDAICNDQLPQRKPNAYLVIG